MPELPEPRFSVDFPIRVFGMDADGRPFSQNAPARNISDHGVRVSGLEKRLTPGELIVVQLAGKKARCKVIWLFDGGTEDKIAAGLRIVDGQLCPWQQEIEALRATQAVPISRSRPEARDKRAFKRHRLSFPMEIRDGPTSRMNTKTADISGKGCYIESRLPLPIGTALELTFWLGSEPIHTQAVVRTCDGGVGMGIEFTGLDRTTQDRVQVHVESMAEEAAPFGDHAGGLLSAFAASPKF